MSLSSVLLPVLFIGGTIALAWIVYFTLRWLSGARFAEDTQTLAGSVIIRVAALHGLILALVFAQEMVDYHSLRSNLVAEATAVADIYNDIRRYGGEAETEGAIQNALSRYTRIVVEEEWQLLSENRPLSAEGWILRETIYLGVLDLVPETPRQEDLRRHMVAKAQLIAELRQERENTALHAVNALFWIAALAGVVLVTVPYFVFSPTRLHLLLLSIYGAFSGLVMFIIYAFADPFDTPGALEPVAFERLLEGEIGQRGG
ncbi:DUF4239 domain-containing protein [Pseudoponticoccus marisrubri]|uniref:DUF4239 domain-containing protein n=1 Tax=Pseudoponticoccus marisrubri TaxID=1685382 RepID=A0A0W7WP16_9RHOB|nr:DUF4239 domain-containing protein [Pseudoponticoccus marisrubri]KUF12317.1 hypothetical protein AVJ23_00850 [Pseudoponticoccus marisrubri]